MTHGGNIFEAAQQCSCRPEEILDFSSNINICSPRTAVTPDREMIRRYGDPEYRELREAVAETYGLQTEEVALFNGASGAIFSLFETLRPAHCLLYAPLYGEYKRAAERYAQKVTLIDRFEGIDEEPPKDSTVVFVNPSTPEGACYDLERLMKLWRERECTVIVDESFLEFTERPSVRRFLGSCEKLHIVQSLTKFYACAGVRVGALFAAPENLAALPRPAWPISSFDAAHMTAALRDRKHAARSREKNRKRSAQLRKLLEGSPLFDRVYPGEANYVMVRSVEKAAAVKEKLLQHRILVRDCTNFGFLGGNHLRFAVKKKSDLKALKKALHALP
jgi:threonine-phosphate decarboxylase